MRSLQRATPRALAAALAVLAVACSEPGPGPGAEPATALGEETRAALSALGYAAGHEPVSDLRGVVRHDPARAEPGYNLVVSGDAPHAELLDMAGNRVHRWAHDGRPYFEIDADSFFWRRVQLLPDGSLLVVFDPYGVMKLDRDSQPLWATGEDLLAHHDLFVDGEGRITVPAKRARREPGGGEIRFEDEIAVLDADGRTLERFSVRAGFDGTPLEEVIRDAARKGTDLYGEDFHVNTVQVLDGALAGRAPVFARGNLVLCSPFHKNVWIVDAATRKVVWNWFGPWQGGIHEATVLDNGNLLLFDNGAHREDGRSRSRVFEIDLAGGEMVWGYEGKPSDPDTWFYSKTGGTVARLANGNTLIVVTESGRGIEVTPDGEVVWEFHNPRRTGAGDELVAALFQLERIPAEAVRAWLPGAETRP